VAGEQEAGAPDLKAGGAENQRQIAKEAATWNNRERLPEEAG
jgi:hypothetical protein